MAQVADSGARSTDERQLDLVPKVLDAKHKHPTLLEPVYWDWQIGIAINAPANVNVKQLGASIANFSYRAELRKKTYSKLERLAGFADNAFRACL